MYHDLRWRHVSSWVEAHKKRDNAGKWLLWESFCNNVSSFSSYLQSENILEQLRGAPHSTLYTYIYCVCVFQRKNCWTHHTAPFYSTWLILKCLSFWRNLIDTISQCERILLVENRNRNLLPFLNANQNMKISVSSRKWIGTGI